MSNKRCLIPKPLTIDITTSSQNTNNSSHINTHIYTKSINNSTNNTNTKISNNNDNVYKKYNQQDQKQQYSLPHININNSNKNKENNIVKSLVFADNNNSNNKANNYQLKLTNKLEIITERSNKNVGKNIVKKYQCQLLNINSHKRAYTDYKDNNQGNNNQGNINKSKRDNCDQQNQINNIKKEIMRKDKNSNKIQQKGFMFAINSNISNIVPLKNNNSKHNSQNNKQNLASIRKSAISKKQSRVSVINKKDNCNVNINNNNNINFDNDTKNKVKLDQLNKKYKHQNHIKHLFTQIQNKLKLCKNKTISDLSKLTASNIQQSINISNLYSNITEIQSPRESIIGNFRNIFQNQRNQNIHNYNHTQSHHSHNHNHSHNHSNSSGNLANQLNKLQMMNKRSQQAIKQFVYHQTQFIEIQFCRSVGVKSQGNTVAL